MTKQFPYATLALAGAVALLALAAKEAQAIPVQIDLGPPGQLSLDTMVPFGNLNGTSLSGQTLSLDFTFANSEFVRLFTVTTSYEVSVALQTNGSGVVGFLHGTGFLTGQNGKPLQSPVDLGSASTSDGLMVAGLLPLFEDLSGTPTDDFSRPLDHFGVNFDLMLPLNSSVQITGGEFRLNAFGDSGPFGIGPGVPTDIVPDSGGTVVLLALSVAGIVGIRILSDHLSCRNVVGFRRRRARA